MHRPPDGLAQNFNPRATHGRCRLLRKASSPAEYIEQNWSVERYSGGGMLSHAPPGVLTQFGRALREPAVASTGPEPKLGRHVRLGRRSHPLG